jgi:hypothetical protein
MPQQAGNQRQHWCWSIVNCPSQAATDCRQLSHLAVVATPSDKRVARYAYVTEKLNSPIHLVSRAASNIARSTDAMENMQWW